MTDAAAPTNGSLRLFGRVCRVTAWVPGPGTNELTITELRMQFTIEKSLSGDPNTCELIITNCAKASRDFLVQKKLRVRIEAGHDGVYRHMFFGDLIHGYSVLRGVDWETKLQIGDGARVYKHSRVARCLPRGVSVLTALKDTAKALGLTLPNVVEQAPEFSKQYAAGLSLSGPARDEMTRLLAPFGYSWSIQDDRLTILRDGDLRSDDELVVSEANGMVNTPEFGTPAKGKPPTLSVQSLLYPELTPGGLVRVQSTQVNGLFKAQRVTHNGDTHGGDYMTELECTEITRKPAITRK